MSAFVVSKAHIAALVTSFADPTRLAWSYSGDTSLSSVANTLMTENVTDHA